MIDLARSKPSTRELLGSESDDIGSLLESLQQSEGVALPLGSAIVFDNIQRCPGVRRPICRLAEEGSFDYIEVGRMIAPRIDDPGDDILPEEHHIPVHPMDFEEHLWTKGDHETVPFLRERFPEEIRSLRTSIPDASSCTANT